jgi:hypothetical protein
VSTERFATALTCIDGRIHDALRDRVRTVLQVDAVDLVTVQGPDRVLAHGDDDWVGRLAERVMVSHRAHGSTQLVIASHSDCAGHPVDDETHRRDLRPAATRFAPLVPGMSVRTVHVGRTEVVVWRPEPVGSEVVGPGPARPAPVDPAPVRPPESHP